jgi:hypothetical protein
MREKSQFSAFVHRKICGAAKVMDYPKLFLIAQNALDIFTGMNFGSCG